MQSPGDNARAELDSSHPESEMNHEEIGTAQKSSYQAAPYHIGEFSNTIASYSNDRSRDRKYLEGRAAEIEGTE